MGLGVTVTLLKLSTLQVEEHVKLTAHSPAGHTETHVLSVGAVLAS